MAASLDRRRANGPETYAPRYVSFSHFHSLPGASSGGASTLTAPAVARARARAPPPQPFYIALGTSPQASGSSYVEADCLRLVCAVYGPRQSKGRAYSAKAELNVEARYAPFACASPPAAAAAAASASSSHHRRRKPGKDVEAAALSSALQSALLPSIRIELLPKATIDVHVTIIQSPAAEGEGGGGERWDDALCLPWASIAASAAIAHAGIEMWALVVGCCASIPRNPDVPIEVHPHGDECSPRQSKAIVTLSTMPSLGSVTAMEISALGGGQGASLEEVDKAIAILTKTNESLHFTVARALQESHSAREAAR
ncbi:Exosomal 3'-5' exoribonuclease complex, subunit Rrp41 and related exoribonucleases [Ceraceosorus bombacis]|uniref:Exosomal 3'-5' exoribonuclease complex, subunit Rrp41 and related exoribonucleases n=1 Tax=Ceraceosorus bombacis TaxID=401625 RepID=A0A0P1BK21_9BASI|nr:Exosomal 3'-5' exoribonuclease complex, subunit Rrp41 and related exoribonucleases [Ceraceosorus bombacis]